MKQIFKELVLISALICLTGCGGQSSDSVTDFYDTPVTTAENGSDSETSADGKNASDEEASALDGEYDIDLTKMNSSMVYAQIADMVNNGDNYLGKTVKVKGSFSYFKENDGREFFAVLVSDATACCAQGIEFVLDGNYSYPDDYPELGTETTVAGEFNYYLENDMIFCQLLHAKMQADTSDGNKTK